MRYASGSTIAERRLPENRIPSYQQEFCPETSERWFRAGEYVAPGEYIEIETHKPITLSLPNFLPARLDGHIACHRLMSRNEGKGDERGKAKKQTKFETLAKQTRRRLYLFACRGLGNTQDAEDLTQETLVRAWRHFDSFDPQRSFEVWAFRIARNLMIDWSRSQRNKRHLALDMSLLQQRGWEGEDGASLEIADSTADPACCLMKEEISAEMDSALDSLPPLLRKTLLLLVEKQSYQQIARACDCSIGTVRSRAHRARVLMRRRLQEGRLHG